MLGRSPRRQNELYVRAKQHADKICCTAPIADGRKEMIRDTIREAAPGREGKRTWVSPRASHGEAERGGASVGGRGDPERGRGGERESRGSHQETA